MRLLWLNEDFFVQVQMRSEGGYICIFTAYAPFKVLRSLDAARISPTACRLDYLMARLSGIRFERRKTHR